MRQLQRPLTRSLAAAWRPARVFVPVTGSGRRQFSKSAVPWTPTEQAETASDVAKPSLFAKLFPDEAKKRDRNGGLGVGPGSRSSSVVDEDQPVTKQPPRTISPLPHSAHPLLSYYEDSSHHPEAASAQNCTIVLNATSKYLTESDFYRVGAGRATHVEGWVGGITKVIQARDPDTLDPLGRYYVTFETTAAAAAWREEVKRLWRLSREHTPGIIRTRAIEDTADFEMVSPSITTSAQTRRSGGVHETEIEAIRREVEGFTLIPPGLPWDLETAKYTAEEQAMEYAGSLVEKLCRKAKTKFLVKVVVAGGRINPETLRTAIRDDGVQRGLAWRIKNLEARVDDERWGIKPFGKSGLKTQAENSVADTNAEVQEAEAVDEQQQKHPGAVVNRPPDEARSYYRFLVPFPDEAEARRFVRNWHRRELSLKIGHNVGGSQDAKEWEEARTLNVTLLW